MTARNCFLILILCGCSHPPKWSDATPAEREEHYFISDDAYRASEDYTNNLNKSVDTIIRMRQ